jgi:N-acetylglucosaminyldiphosphoundecaprenol N-acetyl-beta-D-mannosaminyltransferase
MLRSYTHTRRVPVGGLPIDPLTEAEVVARVLAALDRGRGGWIVTPNVDILRQVAHDAALRAKLAAADLVVADGAPLLWAARLAGRPLPARVPGSDLIWSLSRGLAPRGGSVFVLGGSPSTGGEPDGAHRAAARLATACPGLRIAGAHCPPFGFDRSTRALRSVCARVIKAKPQMVYVGIGFPRQEHLIESLRPPGPAEGRPGVAGPPGPRAPPAGPPLPARGRALRRRVAGPLPPPPPDPSPRSPRIMRE